MILQAFLVPTADEFSRRLDDAQIANAGMNTLADLWAHPQLKARNRWREVGTLVGPIPALLPPGRTDAFEPRMDDVPVLGQHTDSILREMRWDYKRIAPRHTEMVV